MKVKDVMTGGVVSVAPGTSLKEVAHILVERRISGVPVVDSAGAVLGVISEADLLVKERGVRESFGGPLAWLFEDVALDERRKLEARVAGEAMTFPAITIESKRPLAAAAALMLEHGINRLPVTEAGQLIGIVTRADLVRAFARSDADVAHEIRKDVVERSMWLDATSLEIKVDDGEVTLRGRLAQRHTADLLPKLAARVPGVVSVRSELTWEEDD
jgi:CBS domain-containing protein